VRAPKTLVLLARVEPAAATPRVDLSGGTATNIINRLFTAGLAYNDDRQVPYPYLAEALPQLNTDTWRVFPDGRMETTYVLRPGLTWHDGTPLSAEDFVFALRVYTDPEVGSMFEANPQRAMEDVAAPDARTVVIRWQLPYVDAGQLSGGKNGFPPMPRHILEQAMRTDASAVPGHPFWTREHIGLGPYRLERWEPGAFIDGVAFDGHALGRPRIDRVKMIWNADPNTALANLLSGNADLAADASLAFQQGVILKREWAPRQGGNVILNSDEVRYVQIQARPEYANPRAIMDVRVRKALAYAIDRQALLDGMLDGEGVIADTIVSPDTEYYPELDRILTKYPYDPRRTEQVMAEVGITRGADGLYAGATGDRFSPEVRGPLENELSILVDGWRRAGVSAQPSVTPAALATNNEYRASFPAFALTKSSLPDRTAVRKYATSDVAAPENRYGGTNKGGYSHPEFDRLNAAFQRALDRNERNKLVIDMMTFASEQLPSFPLYYDLTVVAHVAALQGPRRSSPDALEFWNIHQWEWR